MQEQEKPVAIETSGLAGKRSSVARGVAGGMQVPMHVVGSGVEALPDASRMALILVMSKASTVTRRPL
ncbi:MAG TPA: hypothetical protein VIS31_04030 [Woeseiaceae bacterium]